MDHDSTTGTETEAPASTDVDARMTARVTRTGQVIEPRVPTLPPAFGLLPMFPRQGGYGPTTSGPIVSKPYHHPAAGWGGAFSVGKVLLTEREPIAGTEAMFTMNQSPKVFRDLAKKEDLPKWHTSALLVAGTPDPTNAVIVDQADVDAAVASLRAHKAYLEHLPNHPDPGVFIPEILRQGGEAAGSEYAVALRVFDLGGIAGGDQD